MKPSEAAGASVLFDDALPSRPYPGLRPFESSEWAIFHGRERMADEVMRRIVRERLLVVHGDSGSGKSSLLRAGVLPRLAQQAEFGGYAWTTCIAAPGHDPLLNVARAFATRDGTEDAERVVAIRRALNFGKDGVKLVAELLRKDNGDHVCLLLDQFEELFSYAKQIGGPQAQLLTDFLIGISEQRAAGIYAILTMRSEFLGACARFPGFAETVNASQYLLPPMSRADLIRAICEPATSFGGSVEGALADRLIVDASAHQDQLPLIQHGLMLLHRKYVIERGQPPHWQLRLQDYTGEERNLSQLLSEHADAVAEKVRKELGKGPEFRGIEDVFRALTEVNAEGHAIRRPQPLGVLAAVCGEPLATVQTIVNGFRLDGASFVRPYGDAPLAADTMIDISHEALVRCWEPFARSRDNWLAREFNNGLVWRALLVHADDFARSSANVLSPATAEDRAKWLKRRTPAWAERYGGGWDRVKALVDASLAARERWLQEQADSRIREAREAEREQSLRSKQHWLNTLIVLALLCAGLAGASWSYARQATREKGKADEARAVAEKEKAKVEDEKKKVDDEKRKVDEANLQVQHARQDEKFTVQQVREMIDAERLRNPASPEIQRLIARLDGQIDKIAGTQVAPRIYVQISEEAQRAPAGSFTAGAGRLSLAATGEPSAAQRFVMPGVELVKVKPPRSELRCFRKAECEQQAPQVLALLNGLLRTPQLKLADYSKFGENAKLRAQHYEVWFAPEEIALR